MRPTGREWVWLLFIQLVQGSGHFGGSLPLTTGTSQAQTKLNFFLYCKHGRGVTFGREMNASHDELPVQYKALDRTTEIESRNVRVERFNFPTQRVFATIPLVSNTGRTAPVVFIYA